MQDISNNVLPELFYVVIYSFESLWETVQILHRTFKLLKISILLEKKAVAGNVHNFM